MQRSAEFVVQNDYEVAARPQDAHKFPKGAIWIGHRDEHAAAQDNIHALIGHAQIQERANREDRPRGCRWVGPPGNRNRWLRQVNPEYTR
jgi:hypothetical protein